MSFIALDPQRHAGRSIGTGHCVPYVREVTGAPPTKYWCRGEPVRSATNLPIGTAIATFSAHGTYGNRTDGGSHAAILVCREDQGLRVWDQWKGKPVSLRVIRYKAGAGPACDDGDQYYIIEPAEPVP